MTGAKFFITGTDTHVGKTHITVGLLKKMKKHNLSTVATKPIASGCQNINGKLRNEDALKLQKAASVYLPYEKVNPFSFVAPIAPHLAAQKVDSALPMVEVFEKIMEVFSMVADVCLVEGIGGWCVPLNDQECVSDLVKILKIPVILVVAIKLGCLNHAILTVKDLHKEQIPLAGWVANCMGKEIENQNEIIRSLQSWIQRPCLGIVPHTDTPENFLDLTTLRLSI